MKCHYTVIVVFMLSVHTILCSMNAVVQQSEISLIQQYLELSRFIDYVPPFSSLPIEIRNKIVRYCLPYRSLVTQEYSISQSEYLFTHLIRDERGRCSYLIGRHHGKHMGVCILHDDNKYDIDYICDKTFFNREFKNIDLKLCQRIGPASEAGVIIKHVKNDQVYTGKFDFYFDLYTEYEWMLDSRTDKFKFDSDLIVHPSLPYMAGIKKNQADVYTVSLYDTGIFEKKDRENIPPFSEKKIDLDILSTYPLLWHPSKLKFLCKNSFNIKEYDALSGECVRVFKMSDLSFDPLHIAYIKGGECCVAVYEHFLYALHNDQEPQLLKIISNKKVDNILGVNAQGNLLLLEMSDSHDQYINIYNIYDSTVDTLFRVPFRKGRVIFDSLTATMAIIEEGNKELFPQMDSKELRCIHTRIRDIILPANTFTLNHLMVYYAQMIAKKNSSNTMFQLPQFRTVVKNSNIYLNTW